MLHNTNTCSYYTVGLFEYDETFNYNPKARMPSSDASTYFNVIPVLSVFLAIKPEEGVFRVKFQILSLESRLLHVECGVYGQFLGYFRFLSFFRVIKAEVSICTKRDYFSQDLLAKTLQMSSRL